MRMALVAMVLVAALVGTGAGQEKKGKPNEKTKMPAWLPAGAKVQRDLVYAKVGNKNLHLDLITPEKSDGPVPLVIWIHGGGWSAGTRQSIPANELVQAGFALAAVQYRLSGEAIFPAAIVDCKAAVRWLRANAAKHNLNAERFGAWGSSAGGHLVALLGTSAGVKEFEVGEHLEQSSAVQAVCDWFGPTDFLRMTEHAKEAGIVSKIDHDSAKSPESRFIGGAIQQNKDKVARANPVTFVSAKSPPFLILHGDKDALVPLGQSKILHEALKKASVESTLIVLDGAGHGGAGFTSVENRKRQMQFFSKHLGKR